MKELIIEGKKNKAICYANVISKDALGQIKRMCDFDCSLDSKIRIMPDVHYGKGCTIGTTMTIKDRVVPNMVGVDIGCGMYTINIGNSEPDYEKLDAICRRIPHGNDVWYEKRGDFDLTQLRCFEKLEDPDRLERSIGTLGGGNHFIMLLQYF